MAWKASECYVVAETMEPPKYPGGRVKTDQRPELRTETCRTPGREHQVQEHQSAKEAAERQPQLSEESKGNSDLFVLASASP